MSIQHIIRARKGGTIAVRLTPLTAWKAMCQECLGWEDAPAGCTSKLCPGYPFRTGHGQSGKKLSPEQRQERAARLRESLKRGCRTGKSTQERVGGQKPGQDRGQTKLGAENE